MVVYFVTFILSPPVVSDVYSNYISRSNHGHSILMDDALKIGLWPFPFGGTG